MAGDTLRDAFRGALEDIVTDNSITWPVVDTVNTDEEIEVSASIGAFALEFPGASETQASFGSPGNNFFREEGQVTIRVYAPLTRQRDQAEAYAEIVRAAFRSLHTIDVSDGRQIRIDATSPMSGGETVGGMWAEAVALAYSVLNSG